MRGYLRGRGAGGDADDLTGDVFVRVAEGIGRFRGDRAALRRWVFTIAHHRLVDHLRSAHHRRSSPVARPPEPVGAASEHRVADPELVAALGTLTDDQRSVVLLRFVADLSLRDVAAVLGKRTGAVKMLQQRGLERLSEELDGPS